MTILLTPHIKRFTAIGLAFTAMIVSATGVAADSSARNSIDGVWSGNYVSTYSPSPTNEILMFEILSGKQIAGVYLTATASAGTASGTEIDKLAILQPVAGCPEPAKGVLTVEAVSHDKINYSFSATSCKGVDNGKGTAVRYDINKKPPHKAGDTPVQSLVGFWNGEYTSMNSPKQTKEILAFSSSGTAVTAVYLSKSGATGILTGTVASDTFSLSIGPSTPPSVFAGVLNPGKLSLSYGFYSTAPANPDIGNGVAAPAAPLPW
ncbi:MAG: hypothetical protein WBD81_24530 [Collimonas pratensis]|uniref:hypothetical protein n=1 Tax=Collimonas pratensis TaxID=279113 RepID=UPI003C771320